MRNLSAAFSIYYYRNVRDPTIKRMVELKALESSSGLLMSTIIESGKTDEKNVRQLIRQGILMEAVDGRIYLNTGDVKRRSRRMGIMLFSILEFIVVILTFMMTFYSVAAFPPSFVFAFFFTMTTIIAGLSYMEARPYFLLRSMTSGSA